MRVQSYQYTPLGFRSPIYGDMKEVPAADEKIVEAWQSEIAGAHSQSVSWAEQRKVINRALDLLGHFPEFLDAQDKNSRLTPHMRAFLEDTLDFINTGRRKVAIISRAQCIFFEKEKQDVPRYVPGRSTPKLRKMLNVRGEDFMYHWLNHKDGFNDMLATMNVLFGDLTAIASSAK